MERRYEEFPRIPLQRHFLGGAELRARYGFSQTVMDELRALSGPESKLPDTIAFAGQTIYTIAGKRYAIRATVRCNKSKTNLLVEVEYLEWAGKSIRRNEAARIREDVLIRTVERLDECLSSQCSFEFRTAQASIDSLWFPLPTEVDGDGSRKYVIEGVAAAKLAVDPEDQPVYRFFMTVDDDTVTTRMYMPSEAGVLRQQILLSLTKAKQYLKEVVSIREGVS